MAACYKCGNPLMIGDKTNVEADAVCERCSSWIHCCANCASYDEYSKEECREKQAPYVSDRVGRNGCAHFRMKSPVRDLERTKKPSPRAAGKDRADRAKQNLDNLFR